MADIIVGDTGNPVTNGTNFQTAINDSVFGDNIILIAGAEYRGSFTLPNKGSGTNYITVRTNLAGIPPEGTRITPASSGSMAKLVGGDTIPVISTSNLAHHFNFIGLEITNIGGAVVTEQLLSIGSILFADHPHHIIFDRCWIHEKTNDTSTQNSTETTSIRGCIINASYVTIKECRIAGFRTYRPSSPFVEASNCILFTTSARHCVIKNNYLEAWFVPVFFGGSGGESINTATLSSPTFDSGSHTGSATFSSVANLAVGDLVAFQTTGGLTPPTNSAHPSEPVVFQIVKITNIAGSVVSYQSWGAQDGNLSSGNPLLQVPDSPGLAQWNGYLIEDIQIIKNQFVMPFNTTEEVWQNSGGDPTTDPIETQLNTGNAPKGFIEVKQAKNLLVDGNTFEGWALGFTVTSRNQGNILTSGGFPWMGIFDMVVSNNWWKKTINWFRQYGYPIGGPLLQDTEYTSVRSGPFTFRNNLIEIGTYAMFQAMGSANNVTAVHNTYPGGPNGSNMFLGLVENSPNFVFKDNIIMHNEYGFNCQGTIPCWPSLTQTNNVIIDNRTPATQQADGPLDDNYPNDFITASRNTVGWIDQNNGPYGYRLAASSSFKGLASDNTDPGVDIGNLLLAIGLSEEGGGIAILLGTCLSE